MGGMVTGGAWLAALLGALAGVALQLQQAALWPLPAYLAVAVLAAPALALAWHGRRIPALRAGAVAVAALAVAFAGTGWRADARLAQALPPALEGRDLELTGIVAGLPQAIAGGWRFRFEVESASHRGEPVPVPPRVLLAWVPAPGADEVPQAGPRAGERWRVTARLRRPHGLVNPHGFDAELWLFEQGLRASGYVRDAAPQRLAAAAGRPVDRWRQQVREAIAARVPDARAAGVLAALAVGDQAAIERDDWDLFRATGVSHLMAISGLHITMIAWLAGLLLGWLWRRSARAALALPAPLAARWGGLLAAAAYAVLAGWGVPAQRTVWMLASVVVLRTLGLRWPWAMVLLAAAVTVSAIDPWAMLQPGFWLSFVAVGLLMASEPAQQVRPAPAAHGWRGGAARGLALLRGALRTQLVATLGLAPLTLLFFQQVSLVGFAANLVAIPVVTLLVTPLALAGLLAAPLWQAAAAVLRPLVAWLEGLAALPFAVWHVPVAPGWAQAGGLLAALLLILPLPWRLRALALPLALPMLWPAPERPPAGQFEIVALDVGQGTAVLVRTQRHLLVYDAGPRYSPDSDAGARVLLPLLRARGEGRVDTLLLSHRDTDHVGGAAALLEAWPVDALVSSLEPGHALRARAPRHRPCAAGDAWTWDGVRFELLHPAPGDAARGLRPNALSCVLKVAAAGGASALLTGDIELDEEATLVERHRPALRSTVLFVPHHGSRTSSSPAFLDAVQPRVAAIQAGHRNRFGHPAPDVLARYRERGVVLRASPDCGAWTWRSDDPGDGRCARDAARRYWHHGSAPP